MKRLFKSVDEKLKGLGFVKVENDTKWGVSYERKIAEFGYIQRLDISHKASGKHLIQSYEKGVNKDGFNNVVGLTYYETKLAMKKYKQLKRKFKW